MKKCFYIICIFVTMFLTSCTNKQKYTAYYTDVFDTFSTFDCYTDDKTKFDEISNGLHNRLIELNNKFDIYNNYDNINNLKTVNDNAGIKPVKVDKDIIDIIKFGKEAYNDTDSNINIAMGSVLKIWHNYREIAIDNPDKASIPTAQELQKANQYTNIDNIVIDENNSTIFITDKNTQIDVGAIAKGYCCDEAKKYLESQNVTTALLNLGGNIIGINKDDFKPSWSIGVQDPDNEKTYIKEYDISNQSAVTSGNYQRYYEYNGQKYHHIIDPKTLMPANSNKSVSIIGDSSATCDMLSTALFILPYDNGVDLANKYNVTALWVTNNNEIKSNK